MLREIPAGRSKKPASVIFLGVGLAVFLCFIGVIIADTSFSIAPTAGEASQPILKPEMRRELPKAERAGNSVPYANWQLTLNENFSIKDNNIVLFVLTKQNWHDHSKYFRYKPDSFVVYDDLGNEYLLYVRNCELDAPFIDRELNFKGYKKIEMQSSSSWWRQSGSLPVFYGSIPQNAQHLYFHIKEFGVYRDITFVFDL